MAKVEHYRGLGTDLEKLYQSIKQVIEDEKDLRIVSEYKGTQDNMIVAIHRETLLIETIREKRPLCDGDRISAIPIRNKQ